MANAQDTLVWNPTGGTGSDGMGVWNNSSNLWYDQTTTSTTAWPGTGGSYANAIIGDGGAITGYSLPAPEYGNQLLSTAGLITMNAPVNVGNVTLNPTTGVAYNIVNQSVGGLDPLILNNNSNNSTPTSLVSNNTAGTTWLAANLVSPTGSTFTLNLSGSANIAFGGSIGGVGSTVREYRHGHIECQHAEQLEVGRALQCQNS